MCEMKSNIAVASASVFFFLLYQRKSSLEVNRAMLCVSNSLLYFPVMYTYSFESLSELLFCL